MTPLQKFIELVKKHDLDDEMLPFTRNDMIIRIAESLLEMEKEQNLNYLKSYFEWHKSMGFVSHKPEDIIEFNKTYGGNK